MFSKAQLDTFSQTLNRKRITQATFDDAVRENVEEFDMEVLITHIFVSSFRFLLEKSQR